MFIDVSGYIDKKIEALKCYDGEMRNWPHSRSYAANEALSKFRGASVGVNAAEAFMLVRKIC